MKLDMSLADEDCAASFHFPKLVAVAHAHKFTALLSSCTFDLVVP